MMTLISQYLRASVAAMLAIVAFSGVIPAASAAPPAHALRVVAVERVYGDLARQLGGPAVDVITLLNSPSADPHAYEATPRDADAVAAADIVIENGLGYDAFADKLVAASPKRGRSLLDVGTLGGHRLGDNPHVWYQTASLRTFSDALFAELARRDGNDRTDLERRHETLDAWIASFAKRLAAVGKRHPAARVAITEPVFDYILKSAGVSIATPSSFSHAIEEGNDPAPQDVETMRGLLANRQVAAFVYNVQTVEPSTSRLLAVASAARVTVVPITETLPANERTQHWMERELTALDRALLGAP